jgi:hypothetical protein
MIIKLAILFEEAEIFMLLPQTQPATAAVLIILMQDNWELVTTGQAWRGEWDEDQTYSVNDLVIYLGNTYKCNFEHLATDQNFPGDNGSGFYYWDLVLQAGPKPV